MYNQPLDVLPLWGLLLAAAASLWLAMEAGYRFGRWRHARTPDEKEQPVGAMVASTLGLLALVLAFTFSLAAARFDARRQTVLEEANAIGTAYLRAQLLPEPQRTEVARLLKEYTDVRIQAVEEGHPETLIVQSGALHEALWEQASAAAEQDTGSIMVGVFIQSLNDVIDLHAQRVLVGLRSRIPIVIWGALFVLALIGMAAMGYQCGLSATNRSPVMLGLVLAFAVVLWLIADLDRVGEGSLEVSQQSMLDLQRTMHSSPTPMPNE